MAVRNAFSLVELLTVITITGILVGLSIPAIQSVRESARRTSCSNNLRQIAIGVLSYEASNKKLPSGVVDFNADTFASASWLTLSVAFFDEQNLHREIRKHFQISNNPFSKPHTGLQVQLPVINCPSDPHTGKVQTTHGGRKVACSDFLGVNGTDFKKRDGVFFVDSNTLLKEITDGTSNTLMIGERPPSADFWYGWWYAGYGQEGTGSVDLVLGVSELLSAEANHLDDCAAGPYCFSDGVHGRQCDALHFWSHHPGGANFAYCDGSIRFLAYENSAMNEMATKSQREIFNLDF